MKKCFLFTIAILLVCLAFPQDTSGPSIPRLLRSLPVANDTARLRRLLDVAEAYIDKPGEGKSDLDSALLATQDLARNYPFRDPNDHILLQNLFLRVYIAKDRFDLAKPYALDLIHIDSITAVDSYIHDYVDLALIDYALAIKDYPLARKYVAHRLDLARRNHSSPALSKSYYQLFKADSAEGRFKEDTQSATHAAAAPSAAAPSAPARSGYSRLRILIGAAAVLLIVLPLVYTRIRINRRNRQLVAEKEWLVKELHHRVRNNLQIVMSLLNTQSHYLDNEKAQAAISQSRNRMYALSLIHQRLYQPDDLASIDMKRYVPDLVQYLRESFPQQRRVVFHLDIDPSPLDVAVAIPIGLILNEAISNSLQYAFPGKRVGSIRIELRQQQGITLNIADDGVGLRAGFDARNQNSMGMQLMETLVRQLEGAITITGSNGVNISIRIPQTSI